VVGVRIDLRRQGAIQTPPEKDPTAADVVDAQAEATTTLTNTDGTHPLGKNIQAQERRQVTILE
jgi:hypothetical protein